MTLRILFAIHGPPDRRTAVFLTVTQRAEFLRRAGHVVEILTPADLPGSWARLQPLTLPVALAARDLSAYDVVVFHSWLSWAWLMRRGGPRRGRAPVCIVAFHGLEPLYHQAVAAELARSGERLSRRFHLLHRVILPRLLRQACRRADRVFCLNNREKNFLERRAWAPSSRIAVLGNGVEVSLFRPRAHPPRATRLLFLGQWLRAKGIAYLTRAFESIAAAHPDTTLTCLGTGADDDTVLSAFPPTVRQRVRVVPRIERSNLGDELAAADLFLFPTLSEGSSHALLEAMASALPIVATPAGAAPDLLTHRANALLVPFADAGALAHAAGQLIEDADLRARLGAAAQVTAREHDCAAADAAFARALESAAGAES